MEKIEVQILEQVPPFTAEENLRWPFDLYLFSWPDKKSFIFVEAFNICKN